MRKFYVYEHHRPDKNECFYVGKGTSKRAWGRRSHNRHHDNIVNKLIRNGMRVDIRVVASDLTEDEAFALERERISFWRSLGIALVNRTDGGEGQSGLIHSAETKEKIRNKLKGHNPSQESRLRQSIAKKGRAFSTEHRGKAIEALQAADVRMRISMAAKKERS
jgi:hypothetical protein